MLDSVVEKYTNTTALPASNLFSDPAFFLRVKLVSWVEPVKVELSHVELAYRMVVGSDGVGYYEPAYLFSGTSGPPASASAYSVAVPAVAPAHIKRL